MGGAGGMSGDSAAWCGVGDWYSKKLNKESGCRIQSSQSPASKLNIFSILGHIYQENQQGSVEKEVSSAWNVKDKQDTQNQLTVR